MQVRELDKRLQRARIVLAVLGLFIAIYLEISTLTNTQVACPSSGIINCDKVLNSAFAITFGIPNAILGIIFFIAVLLLIYLKQPELLMLLNTGGLGFVIYFLYAEYRIGSICLYCTATHVITLFLFLISLYEISRS